MLAQLKDYQQSLGELATILQEEEQKRIKIQEEVEKLDKELAKVGDQLSNEDLGLICWYVQQISDFYLSISLERKKFYKEKDALDILLLKHVEIVQNDQSKFSAEVTMLENKLERIERRLKSDYDTVERLQRCCQEYMGYASDEEQRKNIVETDRTFYEMRIDSSEKLTFMLKKLIETFKKVQSKIETSVNKK